MKSVLISNSPKWCGKICHEIGKDENGKPIYEKRIEVRKTAPKEVPFKAYIYATRPKKYYKCGAVSTSDELLWLANGKVEMGDGFKFWADGDEYQCLNGRIIGEFICDKVYEYTFSHYEAEYRVTHVEQEAMCLNQPELIQYGKGETLYGWHISDLKIYGKPKEFSEFCIPCKVSCENCKNPLYFECCCEEKGKKIVTRPPQSWQYVEEYEK